jgi:hypothetical protein
MLVEGKLLPVLERVCVEEELAVSDRVGVATEETLTLAQIEKDVPAEWLARDKVALAEKDLKEAKEVWLTLTVGEVVADVPAEALLESVPLPDLDRVRVEVVELEALEEWVRLTLAVAVEEVTLDGSEDRLGELELEVAEVASRR